jgi:CIC family chloride channel protein
LASRLGAQIGSLRGRLRIWEQRHLPNDAQHLFALTIGIGAICGVLAVSFHLLIRGLERLLIERALQPHHSSWMAWTILTPTLGGLLAGIALTFLPGARGSGIPQVKQAFATEGGRVRFRDALGKFFISAVQIGSGASLGREGPTVHICAGAASMLGRLTSLPPRNMRRLMPVGVAAGIAAAFNAPIAAVTFTIEEVIGKIDQAVLSGVVVAAALAAVIERSILGAHPVIEVGRLYQLDHVSSLPLYALLGLVSALVSIAFTDGLLGVRGWFQRLRRFPLWAHPAIGGLVTGALAVGAMRWLATGGVTGGGYEALSQALNGGFTLRVLIALCLAKLVATVMSYSSGGAGGIFAPALFVGAMLGGVVGYLDVFALGHDSSQLGAFALVGMGAVFAGVIRAPITSVLIIFEMTGGYGLVLPLMLANTTSYVLARRLRPVPIYEALLRQDGIELPGEHELDRISHGGSPSGPPNPSANNSIGQASDVPNPIPLGMMRPCSVDDEHQYCRDDSYRRSRS